MALSGKKIIWEICLQMQDSLMLSYLSWILHLFNKRVPTNFEVVAIFFERSLEIVCDNVHVFSFFKIKRKYLTNYRSYIYLFIIYLFINLLIYQSIFDSFHFFFFFVCLKWLFWHFKNTIKWKGLKVNGVNGMWNIAKIKN